MVPKCRPWLACHARAGAPLSSAKQVGHPCVCVHLSRVLCVCVPLLNVLIPLLSLLQLFFFFSRRALDSQQHSFLIPFSLFLLGNNSPGHSFLFLPPGFFFPSQSYYATVFVFPCTTLMVYCALVIICAFIFENELQICTSCRTDGLSCLSLVTFCRLSTLPQTAGIGGCIYLFL